MPKDLNSYGTLFGGKLLSWMDELAVILAMKATGKECVTTHFNDIEFKKNVTVNDILDIKAKIIKTGRCYLIINIQVHKFLNGKLKEYVAQGTAKFIALDKNKKITSIKIKHLFSFVIFLFFSLYTQTTYAHPHVWVNVDIIANFNSHKQITSITERWEFDEPFNSSVITDYDKNKNGKFDNEEITSIRDNAFIDLKNYDFYTHIFINDKQLKGFEFKDFKAKIKNGYVVYIFTIPFSKPLDPFKQKIDLGIYDGEYYIELTYIKKPLKVDGIKITSCPYSIFEDSKHPTYMGLVNPKTIKVCRK